MTTNGSKRAMERLSEIAINRDKPSIKTVSFFTRLIKFFKQFSKTTLIK